MVQILGTISCTVQERINILFLVITLFVYFFLLSTNVFITDFSAPLTARVFKFCMHIQTVEFYWVKETHDTVLYCAFFFPCFPPVTQMLRNLCLRYLRIYKTQDFESLYKHWVWRVLCKRESASSWLSLPLFVHFSFLFQTSCILEPESSNFVYTLTIELWSMLCKRKPRCWLFFLLSISFMQY